MRLSPIARSFLNNSVIPLRMMVYGSIGFVQLGFVGAALLPEDLAKKSAYLALGSAPIAIVAIVGYSTASQIVKEEETETRNPWEERIEAFVAEETPVRPMPFRDELIAQHCPSTVQSVACKGCQNYVGRTFEGEKGANLFVCAMHPFGPEADVCVDREKKPPEPVEYRLIRLQGVGFPNLWFARCEPGDGLSEIIQEAIPVSQDECDRLKRRYRLKSGTGLPGCIFKSRAATTVEAFKELMDSCCN
jgi:hypothetical protein